jgi:AcrR family transcriptional regulator
MNTEKRNRLIDSFITLVAEKGMAASGVDTIAKFANVSKKTIYNQFSSKEALAVEALSKFSNTVKQSWANDRAEIKDPRELLLQFFTDLENIIDNRLFQGCIFVNMCREYPYLDHEIHIAAKAHKQAMHDELACRLKMNGCEEQNKIFFIELVYEGLMSKLLVYQEVDMIASAKSIVLKIIDEPDTLSL